MKNLKFIVFIFIIIVLIWTTPAWAIPKVTLPPAASAPAELFERAIVIDDLVSPSGTIQEKVKEIRQEVREKVQQKLEEIKKKGFVRAYVGKITDITDQTLTLDTGRGQRKVLVNEETKIIGTSRQALKFENLKVGDLLIAMGIIDQEEVLTAKRIVLIPKPKVTPPIRRAVFGRVTKIDSQGKIVTLTRSAKKESSFQVKADEKTRITKKIDDKTQKISFSQIALNDRLVAVGLWDEEKEVLTAKIIHIIPGKTIGLEKPTQSPSPTP